MTARSPRLWWPAHGAFCANEAASVITGWHHGHTDTHLTESSPMTIIKINAITVPADSGDTLAQRFAARAGAVDGQPGFEGFELLKPVDDGRHTWLVVTRWADEDSFQTWVNSSAFGQGHQSDKPTEGAHAGSSTAGAHAAGAPAGAGAAAGDAPARPVGMSSELWSYEIAGGSAA